MIGEDKKHGDEAERLLCPQCGIGVRMDEDGCCASCGAVVCSLDELKAMLQGAGLCLISQEKRDAYELFAPEDFLPGGDT